MIFFRKRMNLGEAIGKTSDDGFDNNFCINGGPAPRQGIFPLGGLVVSSGLLFSGVVSFTAMTWISRQENYRQVGSARIATYFRRYNFAARCEMSQRITNRPTTLSQKACESREISLPSGRYPPHSGWRPSSSTRAAAACWRWSRISRAFSSTPTTSCRGTAAWWARGAQFIRE